MPVLFIYSRCGILSFLAIGYQSALVTGSVELLKAWLLCSIIWEQSFSCSWCGKTLVLYVFTFRFVDVDLEKAMQRVLKRHISTGTIPTIVSTLLTRKDVEKHWVM